jgi:hypothetical protein
MSMMAWAVESKPVRIALALIATLLLGWLLLQPEEPRTLVDSYERARVQLVTSARTAAIRVERCPRQALREPALSIDGSPLLAGLIDRASPESQCLAAVAKKRDELEPCEKRNCTRLELAEITPQPDLVATCATLYDKIAQLAHISEACSPSSTQLATDVDVIPYASSLPFAIKLQVAPLVASGQLALGARHIVDAIRYTDDYGRKGYLVNVMISSVVVTRLGDMLDEILTDPRLTADEARAIARDLDTLIATAPTFDAVMRQESRFIATLVAQRSNTSVDTGDPGQDVALQLIALERWLQRIEHACAGKPLRACIDAQRAAREPHLADTKEQVAHSLASNLSDRALRERILELLEDQTRIFAMYAAKFGERHFVLTALRMQAELRTMTGDECRDPRARRLRLARWLANVVFRDAREPLVEPAAWMRPPPWAHARRAPTVRTLRCSE